MGQPFSDISFAAGGWAPPTQGAAFAAYRYAAQPVTGWRTSVAHASIPPLRHCPGRADALKYSEAESIR
jgi:hypothetical protein